MRLIDVDALRIGKANPDAFEEKAFAVGWNTAIKIIESAPTVDAVEVVYTTRDKEASAEMRGANKVIERIKCVPVVEPACIHEPTKSEFKRMAAQLDYAPVVHGRWVRRRTSIYCTYCDTGLKISNGARNPRSYNYCPNCGAKMDLDGGADNG